MARRATFIKGQRQNSPHLLLLDAGDTLAAQRGLGLATQGRVIVEAMNRLGYDAMTLGDEDFKLGLEVLRQRMAEAQFPFLSANVLLKESGELLAQPYLVKEVGGHKVAIIGLTTTDASLISSEIVVLDPLQVARERVAELRDQADVIIILSHLGVNLDRQLASQIEGIDLIIGGHSRTPIQPPLQDPQRGTIIAQAGYRGQWIGEVRLRLDSTGQVMDFEGRTVLLTPDFADDPEMRAFLDEYR